jgi:hypothetical protein
LYPILRYNLPSKKVKNKTKKRGPKKGPKWPKSRVQKPLFFRVQFHGAHAVKIGSKMDFSRNFPIVKHALPLWYAIFAKNFMGLPPKPKNGFFGFFTFCAI